jgi:DNA polymerase III epsilon subunit-like protein
MIKHREFQRTPASSAVVTKSRAVTLDCEMAGIAGGASEAIFLCVTDYLTGTILINHFIYPTEKITQMRSSIHGISKSTLDSAVQQGQALSGWNGARRELWKYIDDSTILVGHALENELDALRIIHPRIVDSGILARSAVGIPRIRWGLKTLCSELLGMDIRKDKGGIHDCMEDVMATREVVLFCVRNSQAFHRWAQAKKVEEIHLEKEREVARQKKKEEQERRDALSAGFQGGVGRPNRDHTYFLLDDDDEILHWSDIAEDFGWPHPDTGYDPWSD